MPKLNIVAPPKQKEEMDCLYRVCYGFLNYAEDGEVDGMTTEHEKLFKTFADAEKHYKEIKLDNGWGHIQFDRLEIEKGDNYDEDPDDYEEIDCEGIDCYIASREYETNDIFYIKQYLEYEFPKQEMRILEGLAEIYEKTSGNDIEITVDRKISKWVRGDDYLADFIQGILITMS